MKKVLSMLLVLCMSVGLCSGVSFAVHVWEPGVCGDSLFWTISTEGTLYIYGEGEMWDYSSSNVAPWSHYKNSFRSVVVEPGVTAIGQCAFYDDTGTGSGYPALASIDLGEVTTIKMGAFSGLNLVEVVIPDTVVTIGDFAFSGCRNLTSVEIGDSVTDIGSSVFARCTALTSIDFGHSVTTIGSGAFDECDALQKVTLPNSLITLKDSAFRGCDSLEEVVFGNSITTIGEGAFSGCTSLAKTTIPNSVTVIGKRAFAFCSSLSEINLPNSITTIEPRTFAGSGLETITLPNSVTTIQNGAFSECKQMKSISIGGSIKTIGNEAFYFCSSLSDVYYTGNEAERENIDFGDYNGDLRDATWHYAEENPTSGDCGENAVWSLENGTLTVSGNGPMTDYSGYGETPWYVLREQINKVIIKDGITTVGNSAFSWCKNLTDITIADSVAKIGQSAFADCYSLTDVVIPNQVTTIGSSAFMFCSMTQVTIPSSVTEIGANAFDYCFSLADVYYGGSKEQWGQIVFGDGNDELLNAVIHYNEDMSGSKLLGDIDGNGVVDISDAVLLFQHSMLPDVYPLEYAGSMDFNKDGVVDISDAVLLFQHSMLPDLYPIG